MSNPEKKTPELDGLRIVVVGSTGKIGGHLVRGLLERGAFVCALGRSDERLDELVQSAVAGRDRLVPMRSDLSTPKGAEAARNAVRGVFKGHPPDAVVDAVGRFTAGSLLTGEEGVWETALEDNLNVHIRLARAFLPLLLERRGEDPSRWPPVTFTLVMGLAGETPNPAAGAMAVTGAAEAMLARVLAREAGPLGVSVNGVVLGPVATDEALASAHPERTRGMDVAAMVAYLVSPGGRSLHGSFVRLLERAPEGPVS
jgi:NAD(P)-dependent dehydrogenase (short-subunit alcohol dehydrogenase family)